MPGLTDARIERRTNGRRRASVALFLGVSLVSAFASSAAAQGPLDAAMAALRSPDAAARLEALAAIDRTANPEAAGAVAALAADPEDDVQRAAIATLLKLLLPEEARARQENGEGVARAAFEAGLAPVRPVPGGAYGPMAEAIRDDNAQIRLSATYAFGVLARSDQGIVPDAALADVTSAIEDMLGDESADVRLAASALAGRVFRASLAGPPPSPSALPEPIIEGLIAAMNQSDAQEQAAAMEALGRARETRALDALNARLSYHRENGPTELAVAALDALARIADPSSVEMVRTLATDSWATNGAPYLSVLFARERLLHDGSTATLRQVASDKRLGPRAGAYLAELAAP